MYGSVRYKIYFFKLVLSWIITAVIIQTFFLLLLDTNAIYSITLCSVSSIQLLPKKNIAITLYRYSELSKCVLSYYKRLQLYYTYGSVSQLIGQDPISGR